MSQDTTKFQGNNRRLDSWKEIASYLGRDERTAKRWEKTRGLPIHRLPGVRSGVFAFTGEIENWQARRSTSPIDPHSESVIPSEGPLHSAPPAEVIMHSPGSNGAAVETAIVTPIPRHRCFRYSDISVVVSLIVLGFACVLLSFLYEDSSWLRPASFHVQASLPPTHVPPKEAEDLYLSGRYFWNKRTPADLDTALRLFNKAIQRDPSYAQAYIGLADTYCLLVEYASLPPSEAYPPAIAAAKRAILLNPTLPEAHRSLAFTSFYWSWDRVLSEKEFRKAIEVDPRDATTHHWFANTLMTSRRYQDAFFEIEEARQLDPTAISILTDRAHILTFVGRNQEARDALLQIEKIDPSFLPPHWYLAKAYFLDKDDKSYLGELRQIASATHRKVDSEKYQACKRGFTAGGDAGLFEALAKIQIRLYRKNLASAFDVAEALAWAGKKKGAIQYLKLAYQSRDTQFLALKGKDTFPMLKDDIEFKELAERSDEPYRVQNDIAVLSDLARYRPWSEISH